MKFQLDRTTILNSLLVVQGVVERRERLPILGNILIVLRDETISFSATDMEIELVARVGAPGGMAGKSRFRPASFWISVALFRTMHPSSSPLPRTARRYGLVGAGSPSIRFRRLIFPRRKRSRVSWKCRSPNGTSRS